MMDLARAAAEEGAGSGEQPEERPKRSETESERLNVKWKRRKGRNGKEEGEKDRPDNAMRTLCTLSHTFQQQQQLKQQQQQQQQPQQRGPFDDEFLEDVASGAAVLAAILTDVGFSQAQDLLQADTTRSSTNWRCR